MQVYIAGVMQGSRSDHKVNEQDYRTVIAEALQRHVPDVKVIDPFALFPESVNFDLEQARQTFYHEVALATEADVLIAYVPEASMGTAIEMWVAHKADRYIIAVTPLQHNWVVRLTANEVYPDLKSLVAAIEDGRMNHLLAAGI